MNKKDIIENIRKRLGIESLNEMQRAVADGERVDNLELTAPTGSGKTLALAIAMLRYLEAGKAAEGVECVVLVPTRELALQWADVVRPIAVGIKTAVVYGGHSFREEQSSLSVTPGIVIATPGRLLDHIARGSIDIATASLLVLDEYDKLLDLGFADDIMKIARRTARRRHVFLSSATSPEGRIPERLFTSGNITRLDFTVSSRQNPRDRVTIMEVVSPERDKLPVLRDLLADTDLGRVIVFVNHRESAERVYNDLRRHGFSVGLYHGGLDQNDRLTAFDLFNNGTVKILVSTDLAARGIDVEGVDAVIHFHLPPTSDAWIHRNGRTARFDARGVVYVITSEGENIPEYVKWNHTFSPKAFTVAPGASLTASIYFNVGKKDKISRGDIVGYLISKGGLTADEIGAIALRDRSAIVAVPAAKVGEVLKAVAPHRIKNTRAKVSRLRP